MGVAAMQFWWPCRLQTARKDRAPCAILRPCPQAESWSWERMARAPKMSEDEIQALFDPR